MFEVFEVSVADKQDVIKFVRADTDVLYILRHCDGEGSKSLHLPLSTSTYIHQYGY